MSDIKQHEINKEENIFIKGYYEPDNNEENLIERCKKL